MTRNGFLLSWTLFSATAIMAQAQPGPALNHVAPAVVEQALERRVDVIIPPDTRLEDALKLTLGGTGVKVSIATTTLGYLPDGLNTVVSGKLKGVKLRDALSAVVNPLGLTWQPREKDVLVVPLPVVERMARRLSWRETQTMGLLARNLWDSPTVQQIRCKYDTADEQLPASRFGAAIAGATGPNAIEQLEDACNRLGWVWRVSDDALLLTSKSVQYQRNLDLTPITIRADNQDIATIVSDLARQAGVPLKSEPGVYALLSESARKRFSISAVHSSVQTVLDRISGVSGLKFTVTNDGLLVSPGPTLGRNGSAVAPGAVVTPAVQSGMPDILGKIIVPFPDGRFFEIFVRKSDLSPKAAEQLMNMRQQAIQNLESQLLNPQPMPVPPNGNPQQRQ